MFSDPRAYLAFCAWNLAAWLLCWCGCLELDEQRGQGPSLADVRHTVARWGDE